jgi:hypothetical protein
LNGHLLIRQIYRNKVRICQPARQNAIDFVLVLVDVFAQHLKAVADQLTSVRVLLFAFLPLLLGLTETIKTLVVKTKQCF